MSKVRLARILPCPPRLPRAPRKNSLRPASALCLPSLFRHSLRSLERPRHGFHTKLTFVFGPAHTGPTRYFMARRSVILPSMITFVGAAVVIATFIVKDIIRDDLRSLQAALRDGETTYITLSSIFSVRADIADVRIQISQLKKDEQESRKRPDYTALGAVFKDHVDYVTDQLSFVDDKADSYLKLLEIVPASEDYKAKLRAELSNRKRLMSDAEALKSKSDELLKQAITMQAQPNVSESEAFRFSTEWFQELHGFTLQADSFTSSVTQSTERLHQLMSSAIENAKRQEAIIQRRYTDATKASYCLYILGSIISLVGQIVAITSARGSSRE
jgi:hypothetical protein